MSKEQEQKSPYDKLTKEQQAIYDMVTENLANGNGLWKQGWINNGVPESIRGTKYRGINNFMLTMTMMARGYKDNRWVTFNQMRERDWSFKTDEEGNSLGKGAGITVEYFDMRDRNTRKPFDRLMLAGMDYDERQQYIDENKYFVRKYYRVFNGDIIDGIPEKEHVVTDESAYNEKAEQAIDYWSKNESEIIYGGSEAKYSRVKDKIYMPERKDFVSLHEFYGTLMHEIGHATGHETRLNRQINDERGYAEEELRAEIASMFMAQSLGISKSENAVKNNSAYIKYWLDGIREDPHVLFKAISDADKISRYVMDRVSIKTVQQAPQMLDEHELDELKDAPSEIYKLPSETVKTEQQETRLDPNVGVESLTRMSDREVVEKAKKTKSGEKFSALYSGVKLYGGERVLSSLMARLAMFSDDKGQLVRIIKSSGQYDASKPDEYYGGIADNSITFVNNIRHGYKQQRESRKTHGGLNAKT